MKKLFTPKQSRRILDVIKEELYKSDRVDPKFPIRIRFNVEYGARLKK